MSAGMVRRYMGVQVVYRWVSADAIAGPLFLLVNLLCLH